MGNPVGIHYWLTWQVPVCALIFSLPGIICAILIKKKLKTADALENWCLWIPCWKGLNPRWLLLYRALVFFSMAYLLYRMVASNGLFAFYFYTQWTFALVMLYFGVGTIISAQGCLSDAERVPLKEGEKDEEFLNSDPEDINSTNTASFRPKEKALSNLQKHKQAGFLGYLMHTIYQISAGAVVLTDIVFWCVLVPMLSGKEFEVTLLKGCIHSLNAAVFLIIDSVLNNLPFQMFGFAYFVIWSVVYIIFQWVLHACGFTWWPYPFLELATPWAPLWYFGLALFHVPCYGLYLLLVKAKLSAFTRLFPHSVLKEKLKKHVKKCPSVKQAESLSAQPYYKKGINCGHELEGGKKEEEEEEDVSSELKRKAVHSMTSLQFTNLLNKITAIHESICSQIPDSYKAPKACDMWIKGEVDRKIPYEEKHVLQQASILGNLEEFGVLKNYSKMSAVDEHDSRTSCEDQNDVPAVIEFGAGRGYLTQTLADCYGIKRVLLVERKAYKLKADRSLRQKDCLQLERLRIDIEDLNLNAVDTLRGVSYLAIGKHLCGPATDLTLRCCLSNNHTEQGANPQLCGLAIATCCHHLCQWKHYTNKAYMLSLGISKEDFHALTWFTSWAVDAKHGSDIGAAEDSETLYYIGNNRDEYDENSSGLEEIKKMNATDRASVGFKCKDIIDMGRLMWIKECVPEAALVNFVPISISPENHLLVAKHCSNHS